MKKIVLLMVFVAVQLYAVNKDWYIGAGFYGGSASAVNPTTDVEVEYGDASGGDLRFGMIFANDNRFEVTATSVTLSQAGQTDVTLTGNDFNWIWTMSMNSSHPVFVPFVTFGFGNYKVGTSESYRGSVNGGFGAYIGVLDNMYLEFSGLTKVILGSTVNDKLKIGYFGIRYAF